MPHAPKYALAVSTPRPDSSKEIFLSIFIKSSPLFFNSSSFGIKLSPVIYATFKSNSASFNIFSISFAIDEGFNPPAFVTIFISLFLHVWTISLTCFKKVPT